MTPAEILNYDFVSVYEADEHPGIAEWLEEFRRDGEDLSDTAIRTFEGDPDFVKVGKHGKIYFIVLPRLSAVLYLEVETEFDGRVRRVIADYFGDGPSEVFTERDVRTWEDFETVDVGVAYRGGFGYVYSLAEVSPEWWNSHAKSRG